MSDQDIPLDYIFKLVGFYLMFFIIQDFTNMMILGCMINRNQNLHKLTQ